MQIYQILNKINNKSYVGKSKNYINRFNAHKKSAENKINRPLYDSMNHHGVDNFELILLEDLDSSLTRQQVNDREAFWIRELGTRYPLGYNMTEGGDGGYTIQDWDEERKRRLWEQQGNNRRGRIVSEDTRKKLSVANKGKIISAEQRLKQSTTNKIRNISPPDYTKWRKGQTGTFTGKTHREDTRKKLSKARLGKSYEDFMDADRIKELKEQKRNFMSDPNNNPAYVDFSNELKTQILNFLIDNKITMGEISEKFNMSRYKLRNWFKELGVDNYQKLSYQLDNITIWSKFWRNHASRNS